MAANWAKQGHNANILNNETGIPSDLPDLFDEIPTENPRLREDVRFWVKAWKTTDIGIWSEMSPTRLTFLEYLLIGVASSIFGDRLLNAEGRNR